MGSLIPARQKPDKLYICLLSIHGLIRGENLQLGIDADTGGQTKYVVDLARALSNLPEVEQVDLVTRRISDPGVSRDYAVAEERLGPRSRIIRIECGPRKYVRKEELWDYLDGFTDNLLEWLGDQPRYPSLIHSHYADAGYVGVRLSNLLEIPLVHTGHSLGRDKRKRLLARGMSQQQIDEVYNIERRIDAEEEVLSNASLVITSTQNEIEEQYELYNYYDPERMTVIPPGTDLELFRPFSPGEVITFRDEVQRFFTDPDKPMILALSRPDERKNILTLIEAYGESPALQEKANLLIVAGNRDDIREMDDGPQAVLTNILIWIDTYDLYGKVAIPKKHAADQVPEIYRMVAAGGGVFINPALTEPFGLTILEAAASGLPVVATENGGPVDIIRNCHCGELVNPMDRDEISTAVLGLLTDTTRWRRAAENGIRGVREHYSWDAHAKVYLDKVRTLEVSHRGAPGISPLPGTRKYSDRMIVADLDQSLVGDPDSLDRFLKLMREHRNEVTFCITTGRRIDSALALMKKQKIPVPDVVISSAGTRIQYSSALEEDDLWTNHIDHDWSPRRTRQLLADLPGLQLQGNEEQTGLKISYFYDARSAPGVDEINALLRHHEITANVILSFGQFMDILPCRASKGQALRYLSLRLDIALDHILVAGGSGADEDMMRGNTLAVVLGNRHHEELSLLPEVDHIYFARGQYASGLLEAIDYYDFFGECRVPES